MKSVRVNMSVPLDIAIQVEKECDKRGMDRAKYIKEALYEKLRKVESKDHLEENYKLLCEEIINVKRIMTLILNNLNK